MVSRRRFKRLSREELLKRAQELEQMADESERESAEFEKRIEEPLERLRAIARKYGKTA